MSEKEWGVMNGPGVEAATAEDTTWFEAHPERLLRLRSRIAGEYDAKQIELPPAGLVPRTLVLQAQAGVHLRLPVCVEPDVTESAMGDRELFAFYESIATPETRQMLSDLRKARVPGRGAEADGRA